MRWLLVLALMSLPVLGAEIRFDTGPTLTGTFRVVVEGVTDTSGQATLLVLRTGAVVQVALQRAGDQLESEAIHVRRPCDPEGTPFISVQLGDTIVAATELGGGLSATAQVGPRKPGPGEPTLTLQRWDNLEMKWISTEEAGPARFRIVLADASADTTCEADSVPLPVEVGAKTFDLTLVEDAAASGRFSGEFVTVVEPRNCDLLIRVLSLKGDLLLETPAPEACLACRRGEQTLRAPLSSFPVTLVPSDLVLSVGCVGEVRVSGPGPVDEVRWCADGVEQAVRGPVLTLYADAPRSRRIVALVRHGMRWGRAEAVVTFLPQAKLSFVAADSGLPVTEPWPCTQMLRVKAENVSGEVQAVTIGKLGPDPRSQELTLEKVQDGVFLSRPIRPSDLGACAGDVLWAQYRDPRGCYTVHVTLALR